MKKNNNKAIKSAESVAALRAATFQDSDVKIKGTDYLAKYFLKIPNKILTSVRPHRLQKKIIEQIAPGSYCFMITRTKHFDNVLLNELKNEIEQLVILGAGYDTRALRFRKNLIKTSIFEVDIHSTQHQKKKLLNKKVKEVLPPNLKFISVDFKDDNLHLELEKNGFSLNKKTLFLWEGVSYYLPQKAVENTLNFVSQCKAGSSIVFDYSIKSFVLGDHSTYGGEKLAKWLKKIKEPFLFGLHPDETPAFLENCSLHIATDLGPEELTNEYLVDSKGKIAGKTLGHVRMVHAISHI